jgi:hypothetical protein
MKKIIIVASAFVVSGCASVAGEKMQPVSVQTIHDNREVAGVGCTLTNDAGSWFVTTPSSVSVHKSTGDLAIDCKKDSFAGSQTLVSKSNGAVWGNILIGGGIGYIIDRNTGAGFDYPATTTVMLRKIEGIGPSIPQGASSTSQADIITAIK